jgi:outer membrane biogenesis lipoprotein LolB
MLITKRSQLTGETHTWDIPVTDDQIEDWINGRLIQDAMPHLTDDEREFMMTGITPKEWERAFGD